MCVADKNDACSILLCVGQGAKPELVAELRFDIPAMYVFHKETSKDVAVRESLPWSCLGCSVCHLIHVRLFLMDSTRSEMHPAGRFA